MNRLGVVPHLLLDSLTKLSVLSSQLTSQVCLECTVCGKDEQNQYDVIYFVAHED